VTLRWAGPALCLAVASLSCGSLFVGDVAWVLVGTDRLVGIDPTAQAALTTALFAALGLGWGVVNALRREPSTDAALDE